MEVALSILSVLGINGILLFFIKRFFEKKDSEAKEEKADRDALIREVRTGLDLSLIHIWITEIFHKATIIYKSNHIVRQAYAKFRHNL